MKVTPLFLLFLLFLGLKLTNVIDWAWIWVFAPVWIPLAVGLTIWGLAQAVLGIIWLLSTPEQRARDKAVKALRKAAK